MLGLVDLEIVLGQVDPFVPPLAPLPAHRVTHAREKVDVGDVVPEHVGACLRDPLAARAGAGHAVLPLGVLRERAEDAIERVLADHPLALPRQDVLPVHLLDRVLLLQVLLEFVHGELPAEEAEAIPQLLQRPERLVHVPIRHEEQAVVEREEILEEVEIPGETLVPPGVAEFHVSPPLSPAFRAWSRTCRRRRARSCRSAPWRGWSSGGAPPARTPSPWESRSCP